MKSKWHVIYGGARRERLQQMVERLLGKSGEKMEQTSYWWDGELRQKLYFELQTLSSDLPTVVYETLGLAERLSDTWQVSGVSEGKVFAVAEGANLKIPNLIEAYWELE